MNQLTMAMVNDNDNKNYALNMETLKHLNEEITVKVVKLIPILN